VNEIQFNFSSLTKISKNELENCPKFHEIYEDVEHCTFMAHIPTFMYYTRHGFRCKMQAEVQTCIRQNITI